MLKKISNYTLVFCLLSFVTPINAQSDAHVHGLASMTIALAGELAEIQFESPAANIVGFEHTANSEQQIHLVEEAEAVLESPLELLTFSGSNCELQDVDVDVSGVMDDNHHEEEHASHEKYEDEHHGEEHASHEEHEDEHEEHAESHSEISANYRFTCEDISEISSLAVSLFEHFPGLEKINALWVTEAQQGSETLTKENNSIRLR